MTASVKTSYDTTKRVRQWGADTISTCLEGNEAKGRAGKGGAAEMYCFHQARYVGVQSKQAAHLLQTVGGAIVSWMDDLWAVGCKTAIARGQSPGGIVMYINKRKGIIK